MGLLGMQSIKRKKGLLDMTPPDSPELMPYGQDYSAQQPPSPDEASGKSPFLKWMMYGPNWREIESQQRTEFDQQKRLKEMQAQALQLQIAQAQKQAGNQQQLERIAPQIAGRMFGGPAGSAPGPTGGSPDGLNYVQPTAQYKADPQSALALATANAPVGGLDVYKSMREMMPQRQKPQYVAPGGVLVDENNDVLFSNDIAPRAESGPRAPSGFRFTNDGNMEAVPGGPADPSRVDNRRGVQPLRKEFRGLQSVKDYETSLPLLVSARKAPDNGYGDLQLIYTAGKLLDPGSVVREGELALTVAAGSPLQRVIGSTRFTTENGGRLTPQTRQQLLGMLNERALAYRQGYDRDYKQYADYAREAGVDPSNIVGSHAANAYQEQPAAGAPKKISTDAEYAALPSRAEYIGPDGKRRRKK